MRVSPWRSYQLSESLLIEYSATSLTSLFHTGTRPYRWCCECWWPPPALDWLVGCLIYLIMPPNDRTNSCALQVSPLAIPPPVVVLLGLAGDVFVVVPRRYRQHTRRDTSGCVVIGSLYPYFIPRLAPLMGRCCTFHRATGVYGGDGDCLTHSPILSAHLRSY